MKEDLFQTKKGKPEPAVTANEMRHIDRLAVEDFSIDILQMMENAGRSIATEVVGSGRTYPEGKPEI